MSVNGRSVSLLLLGALAILLATVDVACGSATLRADGGAGAGGKAGIGGAAGHAGNGGGGAGAATPCVLDSTRVDNCILQ